MKASDLTIGTKILRKGKWQTIEAIWIESGWVQIVVESGRFSMPLQANILTELLADDITEMVVKVIENEQENI